VQVISDTCPSTLQINVELLLGSMRCPAVQKTNPLSRNVLQPATVVSENNQHFIQFRKNFDKDLKEWFHVKIKHKFFKIILTWNHGFSYDIQSPHKGIGMRSEMLRNVIIVCESHQS